MAAAPQALHQAAGFFRVILPCIPYQKKMDLPQKFVLVYGVQLSSTATLNTPNGAVWKIGVKKGTDRRTAWFSKNWDRFVEHHSISIGFFLTFQYLGGSEFNVNIFNLTTCSISYPRPGGGERSGKSRAQPISPNHGASSEDEDEEEEDDDYDSGEVEELINRVKESGIATGMMFALTLSKLWMDCKKGVEEAILSMPPNRPCFLIVVTAALIRGRSKVTIPTAFVAEHIDDGWLTFKLQVGEEEKQWDVGFLRAGGTHTMNMVRGWLQFRADNGLGVGDVCLFQLVSPAEPLLEVAVFRAE